MGASALGISKHFTHIPSAKPGSKRVLGKMLCDLIKVKEIKELTGIQLQPLTP